MQTTLAAHLRDTVDGQEAEAILRRCVHCGFCTATCPTYQLLGDELDGPRGRIYLMKQVLEGQDVTAKTQLHLDRCLTCRNCESTCPSGVEYGRLVEIGRKIVDAQVPRPMTDRLVRGALRVGLTSSVFAPALAAGRALRPMLPAALREKVPARADAGAWPTATHARKVVLLEGCVQPAMAPNINTATARVLDRLGVQTLCAPKAGCCGAIRTHLSDHDGGLDDMRRNVDAWWPLVEAGAEAIVMNASGCGAMVKEYGHALRNDQAYAHKAERISALTLDLAEYLPRFEAAIVALLGERAPGPRVAFHPPCTLQHGQQVRGGAEQLMRAIGLDVALPDDAHLCCGSAGTYSILQSELAGRLRANKLAALDATGASQYCSANIGCITHLQAGTKRPVRHWVELLDERLAGA